VDGLVDRRHPSLALALELLARVRAEAEQSSLGLAMCVVDSSGHVIASQRMDAAPLGAMRLAVGKAYTAVLWGARTGDFMESTQPGGADWAWNTTDEKIVVYAGGLPLYADEALVGGVGASGGTAEQDEACVSAAVRALGLAVEP
jgi:glc operon protein GlcG